MQYYTKHNGEKLAYIQTKGQGPHVVFLSGFKSDMQGAKAQAVDAWCAEHGQSFTRFDYRGHGQSDGAFLDGCISDWLEDTLDILDHVVAEPCILIGSSMGGWLALLAALQRPQQIKALVGIAPAPDFTEKLIWHAATEIQQQQLLDQEYFDIPNCYDDAEPFRITQKLIEDGRRHLLLCEDDSQDKTHNSQPASNSNSTHPACGGGKGGAGATSGKAGSKSEQGGESPPSIPPASGGEDIRYTSGGKNIRGCASDGEVSAAPVSSEEKIISSTEQKQNLKHLTIPIRLLHGMQDEDVPWQMSAEIAQLVGSEDVQIYLIKNAGHRMSEPEQLELLMQMLLDLCHPAAGQSPDPATRAG